MQIFLYGFIDYGVGINILDFRDFRTWDSDSLDFNYVGVNFSVFR